MKDNIWTWGQVQIWAQDRPAWKSLLTTLCADQHDKDSVICVILNCE